jgi:hypothetical protein
MEPCSSRAIRAASSINSVPNPYSQCVSKRVVPEDIMGGSEATGCQRGERRVRVPDAGTWMGLSSSLAPLTHTRAAREQSNIDPTSVKYVNVRVVGKAARNESVWAP